ncbi:hypothetical protein DTL42_23505 [Bremerella cremea]|uniref:FecR protein domain-containing protein n=1 Tax=Bremerella cremea TaxID=1031537 RepID=A0A368KL97_9BACT|nr:FecR domain-containing protein [Bremerella cremea]RCS41519.1 hypothetical protein DTL42_23505 [Bremerella cremea]
MSGKQPLPRERELGDLIAALIDGSITDDQFTLLDQHLTSDPAARRLYLEYLQVHEDLPDVAFHLGNLAESELAEPATASSASAKGPPKITNWQTGLAIALLLPLTLLTGMFVSHRDKPVAFNQQPRAPQAPISPTSGVRFSSMARAKFFGELPPAIDATPIPKRDYILIEGQVELKFPRGAKAIIEGPAVFRVLTGERMAIDVGRCSVHAPDGAEGFQVDTPDVNIVDRGTRFSVDVLESNVTDVQVVEGAADVYRKRESNNDAEQDFQLRLKPADAWRFSFPDPSSPKPLSFNPNHYQSHLPDRIISYEASTNHSGSAENLQSITVQRGGKTYQFPVEDLIPSHVTWFHAQTSHGYLIGERKLPQHYADFARDQSIRTGVINIGGSRQPLTSNPDLTIDESTGEFGTPGMAVQFARPVRNGPGADVVFCELQTFSNPLQGDAFHISPLKFEPGLHSHTITSYDLTLESPESLEVQQLYIYRFEELPRSLDQLQTFHHTPIADSTKFRAIAVGIDLSDLGYPEGALVDGLFFQDALDDDHIVDPTFIAGFPDVLSDDPPTAP